MRNQWSQKFLMFVVIGGYVFSLLGLPGVSVLCYAASGHFAVEAYGENCVTSSASPADDDACDCLVKESHEPDCVDILIQTEPVSPRNWQDHQQHLLMASVFVALPELLAAPAAQQPNFQFSNDSKLPASDDARLALRSVILLV